MEHLNRVKKNEAIKRENKGEKVCLKRIPAQPRACHTVVPTKPIKTVLTPLRWVVKLTSELTVFLTINLSFG
ncbi:60S ribosomal protein L1 [Blastocystis sp. subtype 4]|uniref:60S ribosomal protein L1 n=1 Tax=Blastocystis sp. subtype 4 TaxID=944170 RepID=UPI000711EF24|nr:60S ribosomal protein L1 [Blastocystis sp. subtype 4]KNB44452.1 60S ribosomal protein L1 [Blastocystis sp. subtype 4]|eukprot:XP_014527892.1 60S ribosomal protein L1 [Blastocystis sp. subtype 4]